MSNIPTNQDLQNARNNNAANAAAAAVGPDVQYFTQAIVAAMGKGQNYYSDQIRNVSPAAEAQLKADFAAQGWTITVRNMRTGCSISWQ